MSALAPWLSAAHDLAPQVKPEFARIESADIMEGGSENSFAREHYAPEIEKVRCPTPMPSPMHAAM